MDATRAAQREKERREGASKAASLLVPLKEKDAASSFNWKRLLMLVGAGGAMVVGVRIVLSLTANSIPRALSTPGPIVQDIAFAPTAAAPPAVDSSPAPRTAPSTKTTTTTPGTGRRPAARSQPPRVQDRPPRVIAAAPPGQGGLQVTVEDPRTAEASRLFAIGVAAHRTGDVATARAMYDRVLGLNPGDANALNNLGVLHNSAREYERAEAVLRRAVSIEPGNAGAWNNLGTALRGRGRSGDAIAAFQQALSIDPQHTGARISLAQQYLMISSLQQARQLLEEVLLTNPTSAEASYALGQVLERQGDRAGAMHAYATFVRVAPVAFAPYVEAVRRRLDALNKTP